MDEMINKLRIRHTLYTTLTAGLLLLVLMGGFFGLYAVNQQISARDNLNTLLNNVDSRPEEVGPARCFVFFVVGDKATFYPAYSGDVEYYGEDADGIVRKAVEKADDGRFSYEDRDFYVATKSEGGRTVYAVLDRTISKLSLQRIATMLVVLYLISLIFLTLLGYMYSSVTTAPIKNAFKKQSDLIANASHELKTPLTIISTNLSVMESEPNSTVAENSKWLESINGQISRMDSLIKNMLELSRLEHSDFNKELFDFGEVVEGACLEFEVMCFEKNVKLLSNVQKGLTIYGDKNALERLVIILLDNALKYCGENGKVGCKLTQNGKKAHLEVLNTGEAISKEDAKHVFDRFYRSDGARANPDGNSFGLGLSIAQATVQGNGGNISCKGIEGKGTVFTVDLPIASKQTIRQFQAQTALHNAKESHSHRFDHNHTDNTSFDVESSSENTESVGSSDNDSSPTDVSQE